MFVALKKFIIFFQTSHHLPDLSSERTRYALKFIPRENRMLDHPGILHDNHFKSVLHEFKIWQGKVEFP